MIRQKENRVVAFFLILMLAGFFCLSAWAPESDAGKAKGDNSDSVASASGADETPGVHEQEQAPAKIAKKRFPWLWVAAGAVVVGVVLYFTLSKKPKYKLTVSVGTGVIGTPASGTVTYNKGEKVSYSFKLKDGYKNLRVYLNGSIVAAMGEIEMNRRHYFIATATEELYYDLTVTLGVGVTGTPAAGVYTHKEETSVAYIYAEMSGYKNLKVTLDGSAVAASGAVVMDRNHELSVTAEEIPPSGVVGTWQITTVCSTGAIYEGTLRFDKFCETEHCQRVSWVNPLGGGIGFWRYTGTGIFFTNDPPCLYCICNTLGATALTGENAEYDEFMECQGGFSDSDHMSGTFISKRVWGYGGGGVIVIGTGTWSAYRLY